MSRFTCAEVHSRVINIFYCSFDCFLLFSTINTNQHSAILHTRVTTETFLTLIIILIVVKINVVALSLIQLKRLIMATFGQVMLRGFHNTLESQDSEDITKAEHSNSQIKYSSKTKQTQSSSENINQTLNFTFDHESDFTIISRMFQGCQ